MNFIFDIGNVLVNFHPRPFLHRLLDNPADENKIREIIFESGEWADLDRGTITPEQACARFCSREPRYEEAIRRAMGELTSMLTEIPETVELLPLVKAAGHSLYFLSNYHVELSRYILDRYSFFELFDGGVFSCDVHLLKPSPEIYRCLLDRYRLDPGECLFFDDTAENVRAAKRLGIGGELFTGAQDVRRYL